ncbi:MAG: hypothetical protein GY788_21060 [bacterium]|nr:hypothetical protein [bacterium]
MTWKGEFSALDREDFENLSCPACDGLEFSLVPSASIAIDTGGEHGVGRIYPYYDNGLCCEVRSKKHRAALCRQRGIVPVDGDVDLESDVSRQIRENKETMAAYEEDMALLHDDPAGRELRRLNDRGWVGDQCEERTGRRPSSTGL